MASKTGGCLCGSVRFELAEEPTSYAACHCGMCRKSSGGIQMGIQVMRDGVTFQPTKTLAIYESSEWAERGFCISCGSSIFWRLVAEGEMEGVFSIAAGALDDMSGLAFDAEVYIDHKPDSYAFAGERDRLTETEVLEMAEFQ